MNGPGISGAIRRSSPPARQLAGAARPDDHVSSRGYVTFPHQLTPVGVVVVIVLIAVVPIAVVIAITVAVARSDPKTERADMKAHLRRSRHRRENRSRCQRGEQNF